MFHNKKYIVFFILLFLILLTPNAIAFADWEEGDKLDENGFRSPKIFKTSGEYLQELSVAYVKRAGLDPKDHPDKIYKLKYGVDYIVAEITPNFEDQNSNSITKLIYYPWVLAKDLEGYGTVWVTGEDDGFGYIKKVDDYNKKEPGTLYNILYLHKVTKNLNSDEKVRQERFYGGYDDRIDKGSSTLQEITTVPNVYGKDYFLIYNFVPFVLGTEGSSDYISQGLVYDTERKVVKHFLNGTSGKAGYTGLDYTITIPVNKYDVTFVEGPAKKEGYPAMVRYFTHEGKMI
ncbi:MAG: hypothetical protein GX201_10925, partial [Clostridiales bacterium]|nr:hypothetical protein [Clostridiales bacterium]